jgi:hypothetical protein
MRNGAGIVAAGGTGSVAGRSVIVFREDCPGVVALGGKIRITPGADGLAAAAELNAMGDAFVYFGTACAENGECSILAVWPAVRTAEPASKTNPKNKEASRSEFRMDLLLENTQNWESVRTIHSS